MISADRTVLVTGATGQQGGATARRLLADGWRVRALVREPDAPAARHLASAGADLVAGDMGDRAALDAAMSGVYGVFSVQPAATAPDFNPEEVRFGRNVADAAAKAGVQHLVYTSVGGADRGTGISHWNTKWQIEQHIASLDLPATILRPVMFMENHTSPKFGITGEAALIRMIPAATSVQLIAVDDIGAFAALAFADPDFYRGRAIEVAGDELTRDELLAAISHAIGRELDVAPIDRETLARLGVDPDDVDRAQSFNGWQADIPSLRKLHPGLMDFQAWLNRHGAARFTALLSEKAASS
jgi:uncharacterized protein YbjT (DUF2867 family)